jgi:hypothetical protein
MAHNLNDPENGDRLITHVANVLGRSTPRIVLDAKILGERVDLAIELDEHEHARRQHAATGRLDDFDVLMFLMGLPHNEPVPVRALSVDERSMLNRVPAGAVEFRGDLVLRLARPPVRSVLALVYDAHWQRGLRTASVFAPVATRILIVPVLPPEAAVMLAEASEYGIGVGTPSEAGVTLHVQPECWRQRYFTPGGWLFCEQVFQLAIE